MKYLLLPGLDGTGKLFEPFTARAPQRGTCVVASYPSDRELSYPECAEHVLDRFLPHDEPFVIVGESFSGPVSVLVAATRPAALAGVVLLNSFVLGAAWRGFAQLPWNWLLSLPQHEFTIGLHLTGFGAASRLAETIRTTNKSVRPSVRAARFRATLTVDVRRELASLEVPVMDLRGTRDRLVLPWCGRPVVAARPSTVVARVPGPHLLLQVEPERSWHEIASFASTCASPPRDLPEGTQHSAVPGRTGSLR